MDICCIEKFKNYPIRIGILNQYLKKHIALLSKNNVLLIHI